jgi:two-component system sensor histidine kinase VicK
MEQKEIAEILNKMTDQSDEICFIFDINEKRFQYVNGAFEIITKRTSKELFDHPQLLFKIVHKEDVGFIKRSFKFLLSKKSTSILDFRICRPDKTERWIRLKVYPLMKSGKVAFLTGIAEDDTARKSSIFNMQKVNGWKDSNLEILSHDLRGPIGTVQMLSSIIARKLPENVEVHKLAQTIEDISKRNIKLIQNLLSRESIDTAGVEISKERLDVVWEIHQAMDVYMLSQKNIKRHITFTHSHDNIFAQIDSMKFLQVINNLVSNAIKFTHDDGHIKVHVESLEKTFLVTVQDDGIGIPKKLHPILFNKYTNAGRTATAGEESVGLGMWIVKTLTEAHRGTVWFESEVKKGSKFYVEIPYGF